MPKRKRPQTTQRSEHWIRVAVNECTCALNSLICKTFDWSDDEQIDWVSPITEDNFSEYYDKEFLARLGIDNLKVPLHKFWPLSGPRWDGLAKTKSGKYILVEAKAYIEEAVDYRSKANSASLKMIIKALDDAKKAFKANEDADWNSPFYQYSNRLAHLYFLRQANELPVYLLFLYFADAPDVPRPCTLYQWQGAIRLTEKCLGLGKHPFSEYVKTLIWSVPDMLSHVGGHTD